MKVHWISPEDLRRLMALRRAAADLVERPGSPTFEYLKACLMETADVKFSEAELQLVEKS